MKMSETILGRVSIRKFMPGVGAALVCAGLLLVPGTLRAQSSGSKAAPSATQKTTTQKTAQKSSSSKKKHHKAVKREPTQKAPTTDRVTEIQSALAREGYYKGDPSGKWDADTQDAMRRFQESRGLTGTGKLDAPSLQKLGLGSDIAGVSAPRQGLPAQEPAKPATGNSATANPSGN
jgi:peptidoglycan hydrolase-like protein with peptidoglycan-binding domain